MTKKEYWEQDFYQIGEYGDTKYIKIDGFFYDNGDGGYDENGKYDPAYSARCVTYCGIEMPLADFIKMMESSDEFRDEITDMAANNTQYIGDMTPKDAVDLMHTYYDGETITELDYASITLDTPCGRYVDA